MPFAEFLRQIDLDSWKRGQLVGMVLPQGRQSTLH